MLSLILIALIVIIIIISLPTILKIVGAGISLLFGLSILVLSIIAFNELLEFIEANVPNLDYLAVTSLLAVLILTIRDSIANESYEYRKARKLDKLYNSK